MNNDKNFFARAPFCTIDSIPLKIRIVSKKLEIKEGIVQEVEILYNHKDYNKLRYLDNAKMAQNLKINGLMEWEVIVDCTSGISRIVKIGNDQIEYESTKAKIKIVKIIK